MDKFLKTIRDRVKFSVNLQAAIFSEAFSSILRKKLVFRTFAEQVVFTAHVDG